MKLDIDIYIYRLEYYRYILSKYLEDIVAIMKYFRGKQISAH